MNKKILVVEDDLSLSFLLMELLESEGYRPKICRDGQAGLAAFKKEHFDLCILDVMMTGMDGFTLARHIKRERAEASFLFLTARTMRDDKLRGYAIGADDYLTKPFDEEELICKIKVILRRNQTQAPLLQPTFFQLGDYAFDYDRQELSYLGKPQRLTEKESEVLRLLCLHQNQILRRDEAVEKIYGKKDYFLGRSFDVFISKLRKQLNQDQRISIDNVFKVGFILNVEA